MGFEMCRSRMHFLSSRMNNVFERIWVCNSVVEEDIYCAEEWCICDVPIATCDTMGCGSFPRQHASTKSDSNSDYVTARQTLQQSGVFWWRSKWHYKSLKVDN